MFIGKKGPQKSCKSNICSLPHFPAAFSQLQLMMGLSAIYELEGRRLGMIARDMRRDPEEVTSIFREQVLERIVLNSTIIENRSSQERKSVFPIQLFGYKTSHKVK